MKISQESISALEKGLKAKFRLGADGAKVHHEAIALIANSSSGSNKYKWLDAFPRLREWIGDRVINQITKHGFEIENKTFESTVTIPRTAIEDDNIGLYGIMIEELGRAAAEHPDELMFGLLSRGFSTNCYDGRPFFAADHPSHLLADGTPVTISNMQDGDGPAWFLLDCTRPIKPMIYQRRVAHELVAITSETSPNTFWRDEYVYGTRGRCNVGFGIWQLAFGSRGPLTAENYEAARSAMTSLRDTKNHPLSIRPNILVVPPALEGAALRLLNNSSRLVPIGNDNQLVIPNEWAGTATTIVTPWVE